MITLYIISVLYTIFGTIRFKKLYGHTNLFDEDPKLWTFILLFSIVVTFVIGVFLIVKYLP